ncbi:MAG TPA: energy transducer TonB [Longimicrobium sp.]|jgi:TonB family protein|uniref:energy transducer TonB n=1 Tax=Longimicrobium sp. TaxID=2029185 RepID=UPI002ED8557E
MKLLSAAVLASVVLAPAVRAQAAPGPAQRCAAVPDTAQVLTPAQVRDQRALNAELNTMIRASGQTEPVLVMVDQDSTRRDIHVLDALVDEATTRAVTARVERYLTATPRRRTFQSLLRPGMETPVLAPRKQRCVPELDNVSEISEITSRLMVLHPLRAQQAQGAARPVALLRLVVNREGLVSWAAVLRPTGDAYLDANVEEIAARMKFLPATLDGVAFDSFVTYPLRF